MLRITVRNSATDVNQEKQLAREEISFSQASESKCNYLYTTWEQEL